MARNKIERKKKLKELKKIRWMLFSILDVFDVNAALDDESIDDLHESLELDDENELKLVLDRYVKEDFCLHSNKLLKIKVIEALIARDDDTIEEAFLDIDFHERVHDKRQFLKILLERLKFYTRDDVVPPHIMTKEEAQAILNDLDPHKKEDIPTIVQVILKDYFSSWKKTKQKEYLDLLCNQLETSDNNFSNLLAFPKKLVCQEMLLENRDFIEEVRDLLVSIIMQ